MNSALRFAAPLVLASLVLSLSACKPAEKDGEAETADAKASDTAAKSEPGAPAVDKADRRLGGRHVLQAGAELQVTAHWESRGRLGRGGVGSVARYKCMIVADPGRGSRTLVPYPGREKGGMVTSPSA